jgi:hypothetical protein
LLQVRGLSRDGARGITKLNVALQDGIFVVMLLLVAPPEHERVVAHVTTPDGKKQRLEEQVVIVTHTLKEWVGLDLPIR